MVHRVEALIGKMMHSIGLAGNFHFRPHFGSSQQGSQAEPPKIVYLKPRVPVPDTQLTQLRKNRNRGALSGFSAILLSGLAVLCGSQAFSHQAQGPSSLERDRHELIQNDWQSLTAVAHAGQAGDSGLQRAEFNQALLIWMNRIVLAMETMPTSSVDETLVRKLATAVQSDDAATGKAAQHVSTEIFNYLLNDQKLSQQGATEGEIQTALLGLRPLLAGIPQLSKLSDTEKNELAEEIEQTLIRISKRGGGYYSHTFTDEVAGYLGDDFAGVPLEEFRHIETEADAKQLFTRIVKNPGNFMGLSNDERQAFLEYGLEILASTDISSPSPLPFYLFLMIALVGAAGTVAVHRKNVLGLPRIQRELNAALEEPKLFVRKTSPDDESDTLYVNGLNQSINEGCAQMVTVFKESAKELELVQNLLNEYFGTQELTAESLRKIFEQDALREIFVQRSRQQRLKQEPISELMFLEAVERHMKKNSGANEFFSRFDQ